MEGNNRATFGSFKFSLSGQRVLCYNLPKFAKGLLLKKGPVTNFNSGVNGRRASNPAYGVIVSIVQGDQSGGEPGLG